MIGNFGPRPKIALIGVSMAMETPPRSELCAQERGCNATDVKRILFLPVWGSSACAFSGSSALAQELLSPTGARAKVLGEWVLVRWGAG